jgi:hypothetical protein
VQLFRTQVKRRKALWVGKPAGGGKAQSLSGTHDVLATKWMQSLQALPKAVWRVPLNFEWYAVHCAGAQVRMSNDGWCVQREFNPLGK